MYGLEASRPATGRIRGGAGRRCAGPVCGGGGQARGAAKVIAIDGVTTNASSCRMHSAPTPSSTSPRSPPQKEPCQDRCARSTDGQGADVVVEVVGHRRPSTKACRCSAQFGRYVEIGNINIGKTFEFDPSRFVFTNKTMVGVSLYDPAVLSARLTFLDASSAPGCRSSGFPRPPTPSMTSTMRSPRPTASVTSAPA